MIRKHRRKTDAHTEHTNHRSEDKSFFFVSSAILKQCVFSSYSLWFIFFFFFLLFKNRFNRCSLGFIAITNDEEKKASFSSLRILLSASCTNSSLWHFSMFFLSFLMTLCRNSIVVFRPSLSLFLALSPHIDPLLSFFRMTWTSEKRLSLYLSVYFFSLSPVHCSWQRFEKRTNERMLDRVNFDEISKKKTSERVKLFLLSLSLCIFFLLSPPYVCYKWIHVNVPLLHFISLSFSFFFFSSLFPLLFW